MAAHCAMHFVQSWARCYSLLCLLHFLLTLFWVGCRDLTDAERQMYIDLRPFMQRTPFMVHANASLSRAYRLFRTMGLHHMVVIPPKPMVMGVITRKARSLRLSVHPSCMQAVMYTCP